MISTVETYDELLEVIDLASRWGELGEHWSVPEEFSRELFLHLWVPRLGDPLWRIVYQRDEEEVVGAMALMLTIGVDANAEVRELFWIGGDRSLLTEAEEWARGEGASRIVVGCSEGPAAAGISRIRVREGYVATERVFSKELV